MCARPECVYTYNCGSHTRAEFRRGFSRVVAVRFIGLSRWDDVIRDSLRAMPRGGEMEVIHAGGVGCEICGFFFLGNLSCLIVVGSSFSMNDWEIREVRVVINQIERFNRKIADPVSKIVADLLRFARYALIRRNYYCCRIPLHIKTTDTKV